MFETFLSSVILLVKPLILSARHSVTVCVTLEFIGLLFSAMRSTVFNSKCCLFFGGKLTQITATPHARTCAPDKLISQPPPKSLMSSYSGGETAPSPFPVKESNYDDPPKVKPEMWSLWPRREAEPLLHTLELLHY